MKIIAFGHKSRVGKDTATRYLVNYIKEQRPDLKVERRAFADKVKEVSHLLYQHHGLKPGPYYDEVPEARSIKLPILNLDPVEVWVAVGNRLRDVYAETWVDTILLDQSADIVIISDLRYPNEANRIHQLGGYCFRIDKRDAPIRNTVADHALDNYNDWDGIFENNGSVDELQLQMRALIEKRSILKEV